MPDGVQYVCYVDETGYYLGDAALISTYIASEAEAMTSAWVPAGAAGTLTLIRTSNVQSLWRALSGLAEKYRQLNEGAEMDQTVHLFMPCGAMERYIAFDDLPWASVPCACGNPRHWMITYTDGEPPA